MVNETRLLSDRASSSTRARTGAPASRALVLVLVAVLGGLGCARSALRIGGERGGAGGEAGTGAQPRPDAGTGGHGGTAGGGGTAELHECVLGEIAGPVQPAQLDRADRDGYTPSFTVHETGEPTSGARARVVLQDVTSNATSPPEDGIEATLLQLDPTVFPPAIQLIEGPTLLAPQTWTYAQMVVSHRSSDEVALAWNGGPGRVQLRTLSVPTWSPGPVVDVWLTDGTPLGMASGEGVGEMGIGHAGHGYGMLWDKATDVAAAAVVSEEGELLLGPHAILGASPVPAATDPAVAWSGQFYLIATGVEQCGASDPLCLDNSLVISRFRPASGDAWDDSGVDLVTGIAPLPQTATLGRPSLASWRGRTAVAWAEGTDLDGAPHTVRIARLGPDGQPQGPVRTVTAEARPTHGLRLSASPLGLAVMWPEEGDPGLADDVPGRWQVVVHHLDYDLQPLSEVKIVPSTRFTSYGFPAAVGVEFPLGMLLGWSSRSTTSHRSTVSLAWIVCAERL